MSEEKDSEREGSTESETGASGSESKAASPEPKSSDSKSSDSKSPDALVDAAIEAYGLSKDERAAADAPPALPSISQSIDPSKSGPQYQQGTSHDGLSPMPPTPQSGGSDFGAGLERIVAAPFATAASTVLQTEFAFGLSAIGIASSMYHMITNSSQDRH